MKPGDTYGLLTLLHVDTTSKILKWHCRCACGKEKSVQQNHIRSGATRSCGCQVRKQHQNLLATLRDPQLVGRS